MRPIDYPPTSETLRLRVLVEQNGHTARRESAWLELRRREANARRYDDERRKRR